MIPLAVSLKVTCNYQIATWSFITDHYQCQVTELQVETSDAIVESVDGQHLPGKTVDDVKSIQIDNQVCMFMPQRFDSFFKNIEGIQINAANLTTITQADLKPFPNLKQLILKDNEIVELSADLFEFNRKLIFLDFTNNNLNLIPENIFSQLEKLESIMLVDNICITKSGYGPTGIQEVVQEIAASCHGNSTDYYEATEATTDVIEVTTQKAERKTTAKPSGKKKFLNKRKGKNHWGYGK